MTNLGPHLGDATDAARITASKNYLVVVLRHSVIVFVPMFLCLGWLHSRYDFRPAEVLLLFGLTGTLAETITFGPKHLAELGMWVFVYGLMVSLPACTVPVDRGSRPARWWHAVLALFLPLVFIVPLGAWLAWTTAAAGWRRVRGGSRPVRLADQGNLREMAGGHGCGSCIRDSTPCCGHRRLQPSGASRIQENEWKFLDPTPGSPQADRAGTLSHVERARCRPLSCGAFFPLVV
jgi:hypothetical protein